MIAVQAGLQLGVAGQEGGLDPVVAAEFGEDAADVRLDRRLAHVDAVPGVGVGQALAEQVPTPSSKGAGGSA